VSVKKQDRGGVVVSVKNLSVWAQKGNFFSSLLRKDDKVKILHNIDDVIIQSGQLLAILGTSGCELPVFPLRVSL
jgi:ABC-type dipeptide/oligopeptide/nickel transport system ATPase subunit